MREARLCYIDGQWAYFTTQDVTEQWGDDWNDAPYEHNAGAPYEDWRSERDGEEPKWTITKLAFESALCPPCEPHYNSPWCVQQINRGEVAWLRDHYRGKSPAIMAGVTLDEFCEAIQASGGTVYLAAPVPAETEVDDG